MEKQFSNGFTSWIETHHEVVKAITLRMADDEYNGAARARAEAQGTGGLYELAEELTDKFEAANKGRQWDGEFFEEVEEFLNQELK